MTRDAVFRWADATDKRRGARVDRPSDSVYRVAHLTDMHLPSDVDLFGRLVDLVGRHDTVDRVSKSLSALSNSLAHDFIGDPDHYSRLLRKALYGLHMLDVDHLVLTGDLVHCGLAREFLEVKAALEGAGWWGEERMTVVPGNHDRFNLYDHIKHTQMGDFYPVVTPKEPAVKLLGDDFALLQIDSNRHPDDPHAWEEWLPNTVGRVYPEVIDWIEAHGDLLEGRRVLTLLHHHVTDDWYEPTSVDLGDMLAPADGVEALMEAVEQYDPSGPVLHGHQHKVMSIDYTWRGHRVSCPGGFHLAQTLNLIDFPEEGREEMTQLELRL